jgi:lysophospholipase L1-like esterase
MNKKKKILIIGDSNILPRYNVIEKDRLQVEDRYIYLLKDKLTDYHIEYFAIGGVTSPELFNFSIPYFTEWKPDYVIIQSGINDAKSQFVSDKTSYYLYRLLSFFGLNKSIIKEKLIYNNKLIKIKSTPKISIVNFEKQIKKIRSLFSDSRVLWIEIYSDTKIEEERFNTLNTIKEFNSILKSSFSDNFIELGEIKNIENFTTDGYHLNKKGNYLLFNKLSRIILKN